MVNRNIVAAKLTDLAARIGRVRAHCWFMRQQPRVSLSSTPLLAK
jgi:hypothetical protein